MAPKKKQAKKPAPKKAPQAGKKSADEVKKPAPKKPNRAGKKSTDVAKKTPSQKPVAKTPTATKKETKTKATKSTSKADLVVENQDISDKPAGRTRAAARRAANKEPTESTVTTLTTTTTTKKSQGKAAKTAGTKSIATNKRSPEPVDDASENDTQPASPKRKRATGDKSTDTTDLPRNKSPKLHEGSSPGPSRNRKYFSALGDLGSERCDTSEVGSDTYCTVAVELSRIPSPFANLTDRADRPEHFVNNHAHPEVKVLFHRARDYIRTSRAIGLNISTHGTFVALQHGSTAELEFSQVRANRPHFSLDREGATPGVPLDFQVSKNAKTGERDYFIINEDCDICIVNDRHVGRRLTAGPLPDFVVILTESWVVFWWRTRAAIDYVPRAVSEDTQEVEEQEGTTKEPSPPPGSAKKGGDNAEKPSSPAPGSSDRGKDTNEPGAQLETWEDILSQGLALHRSRLDGLSHKPYEIKEYNGMDHEAALVAVATIWDALRNLGTYAFVGHEHLDPAFSGVLKDGSLKSVGVVGGVNGRFIMPLFFEPSQKKRDRYYEKNQVKIQMQKLAKLEDKKKEKSAPGPLGHILLAVARRRSPETNQVDIEIRDSLPGYETKTHIEERAQMLAAKWLDVEEVTLNSAYVTVIEQPNNVNPCGLLTILNAWAVMLGIPLLGERKRSKHRDKSDREFFERALEIVNLALAGCMNSRTIQAFLNVYGYSAAQDVQDHPEHSIDAVRMDPARLERSLQRQKHKDAEFPSPTPSPSSSQGPAHSSSSDEERKALLKIETERNLVDFPDLTWEQAENLARNMAELK